MDVISHLVHVNRLGRVVNIKMATAHMNLGAMLHFNGKLAEAEQSYTTALRLKPDDHVTQANLKKLQNLMKKTGDTTNSTSRR